MDPQRVDSKGKTLTSEGLEQVLEEAANNARVLVALAELRLCHRHAELELLEAHENVWHKWDQCSAYHKEKGGGGCRNGAI